MQAIYYHKYNIPVNTYFYNFFRTRSERAECEDQTQNRLIRSPGAAWPVQQCLLSPTRRNLAARLRTNQAAARRPLRKRLLLSFFVFDQPAVIAWVRLRLSLALRLSSNKQLLVVINRDLCLEKVLV